MPSPIVYYRQNDPLWANVTIGKTKLPLWRWGCTITALCTLLSSRGYKITPGEMAKLPGLYNDQGEMIWANLPKATKGMVKACEGRIYGRNDAKIRTSILGGPTLVAMLQVEIKKDKHWLAAIGVLPGGEDYWVSDPLDGKRKQLSKAYPGITGSAHLILS
ncbi:MAG TPA: hypothetical protein PLI01_00300 [Nitrospira sp.]|nr:hypothetical protein [Nitrospira sp.]HNA25199.1 hypothetical protein [Nitrospira sp.]HNI17489.1 hypothetical protein [Nitrospira sp.]